MKRILFLALFLLPAIAFAQGKPRSGGSVDLTAVSTAVKPSSDNALSLGDSTHRWSGIYVPALQAGATTMTLTSSVANSGTNVAFVMNSSVTLSGTTKLLQVTNNGTEKFWAWNDGAIGSANGFSGPTFGDSQGVPRLYFNQFTANDSSDLRGRAADGASAVGVKIGNGSSLTNASAKILAVYSDHFAAEVFTVYGSGATKQAAETLKTCASGTEGAISRDTAAGGTSTHRTRVCLCTSDGAATPVYKWQNMVSGTLGTTTTCAD